MEVHTHTHTARKKWTHYLWEFLMLFLAVFCGFLAENIREHKIEKDRERQFIRSMIKDLQEDTTELKTKLTEYKQKGIELDSLIFLLNTPGIKEEGIALYYYGRRSNRIFYFSTTDPTIQQMRNSGGFRLIRDDFAASAILKYYGLMSHLNLLQTITQENAQEYRAFSMGVFNPLVFQTMVNDQTNDAVVKATGNPELLTYDKPTLLKLTSILHYLQSARRSVQKQFILIKQEAENLIDLLKKEYHLK